MAAIVHTFAGFRIRGDASESPSLATLEHSATRLQLFRCAPARKSLDDVAGCGRVRMRGVGLECGDVCGKRIVRAAVIGERESIFMPRPYRGRVCKLPPKLLQTFRAE
ncbi:hypothetical protein P9272_29935 [Mesorhizobium sp. WSM4976]|uniref:hypothetical protein n=1 Tax=Mesorhizobium sp. WSM4976 TaxID=3038549 RepID=UPI002417E818|nr:hypothetical protein [Mesorhizobium sp. WSM4976]MDG4897764.1 hypothetical protein [Mesorhizobium sp. WSM4976]